MRHAPDDSITVGGELSRRIDDLMAHALTSCRLPALSTPTHKRGFIHPDVLVERVAAHQAAGASSSLEEQVRALLRLPAGDWPAARARARTLAPSDFSAALRYALGDAPGDDIPVGANRALFVAAARIRHPNDDDALLARACGDMGQDGAAIARYRWSASSRESHGTIFHEPCWTVTPVSTSDRPSLRCAGTTRWCTPGAAKAFGRAAKACCYTVRGASIFPSNLDAFFANGAVDLCSNRDWWEARWQDKAYLVLVSDASVPMTPLATRVLACALGGKEAAQTAVAVDAFVAACVESRLDAAVLGGTIRELLETQLGLAARYATSLAMAARAHPAMPAAVVAALCALIGFEGARPPKDTGALLELLHELAVANGLPVSPEMVARIGRLALTGKARAAQRDGLARFQSDAAATVAT